MDDQILDEDTDVDEAETPAEDELDDEELDDEELDDELEDGAVASPSKDDDDDDDAADDDEEDDDAPAAKSKASDDDDEDEDDDDDDDDVEADLDAILKDRIAASSDDDEDEEEAEVPVDRNDPDVGERVAAKSAEEFTCAECFMIVHPRQFGRLGHLVCPEGYDPCPSVALVGKRLKRAAKK